MEPTRGIVVRTFSRTIDADLAASQLRSADIDCTVTGDDCGGMYPPLGSIKLLVEPDVADAARDILRQAGAGVEPVTEAEEPATDSRNPSAGRPRVYRFNSGMIVGLILGALLHYSYRHYEEHRDRTEQHDYNGDGVADEEVIWRNGKMVERRFDRDGNGRWDWWSYGKNGLPTRNEVDDNFDGKPDGRYDYSPRSTYVSAQLDTDFNAVPDAFSIYTNGVLKQTDWRTNGARTTALRQMYRHGVLDEELRDLNGDGLFDISIKFDAFSTPIRTNNLRPITPAP